MPEAYPPPCQPDRARVLILGGTADARSLAQAMTAAFPRWQLVMSLAGRTRAPMTQGVPTRVGGFDGASGLARWLIQHDITLLIVATHPFAARMPVNAAQAARLAEVPVVRLLRPPWQPEADDNWQQCQTLQEAPALLGSASHTVFLPIGRQSLSPFAEAPHHHYVVRSIEPLPDTLRPPRVTSLRARGPFTMANEMALMRRMRITRMVCKNSGAPSMAAKLRAARALSIPVIMVAPPAVDAGMVTFDTLEALIGALH